MLFAAIRGKRAETLKWKIEQAGGTLQRSVCVCVCVCEELVRMSTVLTDLCGFPERMQPNVTIMLAS